MGIVFRLLFNSFRQSEVDKRYHRTKAWHGSEGPSVLIIGYPMFRILTEIEEDNPLKEKLKVELCECLQDPGPDMVVCDEGHVLRNCKTGIAKAMSKIRTRRRICMTGTPLQNNLIEYHTIVDYVKPGLIGTPKEFSNRFGEIIKQWQTKDASDFEVMFMKRRCHVLYELLKPTVNRMDYRVLVQTIPPKVEYAIQVLLTEKQISLYREFLTSYSRQNRVLADYHILARIWTHPYLLLEHENESERKRVLQEDFIDDEDFVVSDDETLSADYRCEDLICQVDENLPITSNHHIAKIDDFRESEAPTELKVWYSRMNLITEADKNDFAQSNKLMLLQQIIKNCEVCGDKVLVFSQSLKSLRIIRRMLEYLADENQWFVGGHQALMAKGDRWGWQEGDDFLVINGGMQSKTRDYIQDKFNDSLNQRTRLLLISTRAGSLGTNLVSANRVIIFDACWNPLHDTQALFRVYRYGQTKPVYIYRLIAQERKEAWEEYELEMISEINNNSAQSLLSATSNAQ